MRKFLALVFFLMPVTLYATDGKTLYNEHCRACHGEAGISKIKSLPSIKDTNMSATQIKAIIRNGLRTGSTTEMPANRTLSQKETNAIIEHVEKLRAVNFNNDVYPIFKQYCLSCHSTKGSGYKASGFSVENYEGILNGTKYGPVVIPGSSIESTLLMLVEHRVDPSIHMPFKGKKLPYKKIDILRKWIDQGAKNN